MGSGSRLSLPLPNHPPAPERAASPALPPRPPAASARRFPTSTLAPQICGGAGRRVDAARATGWVLIPSPSPDCARIRPASLLIVLGRHCLQSPSPRPSLSSRAQAAEKEREARRAAPPVALSSWPECAQGMAGHAHCPSVHDSISGSMEEGED